MGKDTLLFVRGKTFYVRAEQLEDHPSQMGTNVGVLIFYFCVRIAGTGKRESYVLKSPVSQGD